MNPVRWPASWRVLDGKTVGETRHDGMLTQCGSERAVLEHNTGTPLTDGLELVLRVDVDGTSTDDIYARVIDIDAHIATLQFTSLTDADRERLTPT